MLQNQEFLREAALDFSPLYSGKAQTLYEMATDSVFIERRSPRRRQYTPLPYVEMSPKSIIVELDDDIFMAEFNVYPNPTRDKLYIEYNFMSYSEEGNEDLLQTLGYKKNSDCSSGEIRIYTIDGKLIISKTLEQPSGIETIDMQNYPPASYIIKITDCYGFTKEQKFIKQ
ncbi:MAG: T9SS type A sorting domain-containing protein [Bacteroidales bacterium]|nr:T9SS type A sorting domain-containing protein [Bacteroidales bacterium]